MNCVMAIDTNDHEIVCRIVALIVVAMMYLQLVLDGDFAASLTFVVATTFQFGFDFRRKAVLLQWQSARKIFRSAE